MKNHKGQRKKYEESGRDKYEELKGELRKLRKEVSQLRRENAKLRGRDLELKDLIEEYHKSDEVVLKQNSCPKCGSKEVKVIEELHGDQDYYFCENPYCNARGPIK